MALSRRNRCIFIKLLYDTRIDLSGVFPVSCVFLLIFIHRPFITLRFYTMVE